MEFIGLSTVQKIICLSLLFTSIVSTSVYGIILPDVLGTHNVGTALAPQRDYNGNKLYEYINGGADIYFNYGFKACFTRKYGIKNSPGSEIKVNVYDLERPVNAFGIFRELFDTDSTENDIGTENVSGNGYFYFWKHSFYVEVDDASKKKQKGGHCREIAQEIAKTLPGTNIMPSELGWLPEPWKVNGSERYIKKNFLSRSFLNNVIYASYLLENAICTLFILNGDTEEATRGIFAKLGKIYQSKDKLKQESGLTTMPCIFADELLAVCNGNKIIGVVGMCPPESGRTLILRCIQRLP